jgi:hypothetical protein
MKNFLVLTLMFLSFSFASAEIPNVLDDDVGIEQTLLNDSFSLDAVAFEQSVSLDQSVSFDYLVTQASTLEKINRIDRTFFVPTYNGADMFRRNCYKQNYINKIEKPPLQKRPLYLSSFRSVYNWSSLRA